MQVEDPPLGDRGGEPVACMTDHPAGQIAPIGAACNTDFCSVGPALGKGVVETGKTVRLSRLAPVAFDGAGIRFAVAFGTAWVGI